MAKKTPIEYLTNLGRLDRKRIDNNISKIRKFLNMETTKSLVHAFITSKVDYCNSLLYGVPKYLLLRLQRVLNCAARIVFKSDKYDHITPLPKELHWLPVE